MAQQARESPRTGLQLLEREGTECEVNEVDNEVRNQEEDQSRKQKRCKLAEFISAHSATCRAVYESSFAGQDSHGLGRIKVQKAPPFVGRSLA